MGFKTGNDRCYSVYCLSTDTLVDLYFLAVVKLLVRSHIFGGNEYPLRMSWMQMLIKLLDMTVIKNGYNKSCFRSLYISLTVIRLPRSQLCAIIDSTASLTRRKSLRFNILKKKLYGPFLWKCYKLLRGNSSFFTTKSPGGHGTHLINLGRMKDSVDLGTNLEPGTPR